MNDINITFEQLDEFDNHKLVTYFHDSSTGLKGFIAIHRGDSSHPAFGATRLWNYSTEKEALVDVLKLSRMMSYKAALAGLNYGGAKAVIMNTPQLNRESRDFLKSYVEKVGYFAGKFITGCDVGISDDDVKFMKKNSEYIVGTKVDPVKFTAMGIFSAIKSTVNFYYGSESISGKSFAIQGLGKIGHGVLDLIYNEAGNIYVTDVNQKQVAAIKTKYPKVKVVDPQEIYSQKVDIFSPCALGGSLNTRTIVQLQCKMIVGGANNQLESSEIGEKLYNMGILYAPDYIVNGGGLISVVDEYENKSYDENRITKKVLNIGKTLTKVLRESKKSNKPCSVVADSLAVERIAKFI